MTSTMFSPFGSNQALDFFSRLLLPYQGSEPTPFSESGPAIADISREEFDDDMTLASAHHVVMRGLEAFLQIVVNTKDDLRTAWVVDAVRAERARIENAISYLQEICLAFEAQGYDVTVIKSLDHWPDMGSDLDLYTNANRADVVRLMARSFNATLAPPSWGDRLGHKSNFVLPGLPEAVEIHMGRLGQTGEQVAMAAAVARRARSIPIGSRAFRVPAPDDRVMISVLQRMYRHFNFRLCDIVNTAALADSDSIDYDDLRFSAKTAGIWKGVATYLVIVSDYLKYYRGDGLALPSFARKAARFGGESIFFSRGFLRVPILPQSASLFASQLTTLLLNRELKNTARLSLLPCLATAATVGQKITGSKEGIW